MKRTPARLGLVITASTAALIGQSFGSAAFADTDLSTLTKQIGQLELENKLMYLVAEKAKSEAKIAKAKAEKEKAEAECMAATLTKIKLAKELEAIGKGSSESK